LLLNRTNKPWMGKWNGVGGKIECNETPIECAIREVKEETNISINTIYYRGILSWKDYKGNNDSLYLFHSKVEQKDFDEIKHTNEGILSWKRIKWILDPDNFGIVHNVKDYLENVLYNNRLFEYHYEYSDRVNSSYKYWEITNN
jgi:8-oxo-dGTP diphosphatase